MCVRESVCVCLCVCIAPERRKSAYVCVYVCVRETERAFRICDKLKFVHICRCVLLSVCLCVRRQKWKLFRRWLPVPKMPWISKFTIFPISIEPDLAQIVWDQSCWSRLPTHCSCPYAFAHVHTHTYGRFGVLVCVRICKYVCVCLCE